MRILNNTPILERQSENFIKGELSNIASVVQAPQILLEYFSIDADRSTTITGTKNIEDYIGKTSNVVYNLIHNLPVSGIESLASQSVFDDDTGFEEDYTENMIVFPNTVVPKPYDCFVIKKSEIPALYIVNDVRPTTVRSNPFVEVNFQLFSRDPEKIKQLYRQVGCEYETTVTAIGPDHSLVIKQSAYFDIQHHVEQYLQVADLYQSLFYDREKAACVFDGLPGVDGGGCMGYIAEDDLEDALADPNNPNHALASKVTALKNGSVINERGDKFYIVDGEPVVVPGFVPYWFVRNTVENKSMYDKSDICQCETCRNKTCKNCGCSSYFDYETKDGDKIVRQVFVDITLWKLMFNERIIIFDDVATYAGNNYHRTVERLYTDSPDSYVDEHHYKRSVLYRLLKHDKKPFEFVHPECSEVDPRIAKFQGKHIYYLDYYDKCRSPMLNPGYYNIWDDEFQLRLENKDYYPDDPEVFEFDYQGTRKQVQKLYPFNQHLRNAIIAGYHGEKIDWDKLEIENDRSIENYTLLPILLAYYKEFIQSLQH